MKWKRSQPFNEHDNTSREDIRLWHIRDRLLRHQAGISVCSLDTDFKAHAADDIDWLLRHVEAIQHELGTSLDELGDFRQTRLATAQKELKEVRDTMLDVATQLERAQGIVEKGRNDIDRLQSSPIIQLEEVRKELSEARRQIKAFSDDNTKLRAELARLPPTWVQRLQSHGLVLEGKPDPRRP
jgi:chromosome segregation ATPase